MMKYSIIVPVYNRPDEVDELLQSLCEQDFTDFEVIVVEDGSQVPCDEVCRRYEGQLDLKYFMKPNSGPGQSRNYGAERAQGEWLIVLDSDVVLPEGYLKSLSIERGDSRPTDSEASATEEGSEVVCFGGPDAASDSFTPVQKAISYAMTSFFTTGGIRGSAKSGKALDKFYPRSFNMGIRRDVYLQLGGFSKMRFGEDIDFSYRIVEAGYKTMLLPEAWVWHKRRTDFRKFFRQVFNSGIARINLEKRHPGTMKLVHLLPAVFTLGVIGLVAVSVFCPLALLPIILYSLIIFIDSTVQNRSLWVGLLSVPAAFVQLTGYGLGFLKAWWKRIVLKQDEFTAFEKNFYK